MFIAASLRTQGVGKRTTVSAHPLTPHGTSRLMGYSLLALVYMDLFSIPRSTSTFCFHTLCGSLDAAYNWLARACDLSALIRASRSEIGRALSPIFTGAELCSMERGGQP